MNNELRKIIETRLKNAKANAFNLGTETITGKMFLGKAELLESILNEYIALTIPVVGITLKEKHTPTFEDFMTNFCKHGITLTNNYTRETISLKDLIRKYKLTNNIKP